MIFLSSISSFPSPILAYLACWSLVQALPAVAPTSRTLPANRNVVLRRLVKPKGDIKVEVSTSSHWRDVTCDNIILADPTMRPDIRWAAADADNAWIAAVEDWKISQASTDSRHVKLPFAAHISAFFKGPESLNCQNIGDAACSVPINCKDAGYPAGYLIINSFAAIHGLHQQYQSALQTAFNVVEGEMGNMISKFCPDIPDPAVLIRQLFNGLSLIVNMGQGYLFNTILWDSWRAWALERNWGVFWVLTSTFGNIFNFAVGEGNLNLKTPAGTTGTQNNLSSILALYFGAWMDSEASLIREMFSGASDKTNNRLLALMKDGKMTMIPPKVDLSNCTVITKKLFYGQIIPLAWQLAPRHYAPIILKVGNACSDPAPKFLRDWMTVETMKNSGVCYDGIMWYVVSAQNNHGIYGEVPALADGAEYPFTALPGSESLDGKTWGGLTLMDMVVSSWGGYKANNYQNGYSIPVQTQWSGVRNEADMLLQNGVQLPGFFTLSVCRYLWNTLIQMTKPPEEQWPCKHQ